MPLNQISSLLTISTVASQIGVSVDTLRKWESRHGWPQPLRTPGGTRLFDDKQLEMLRCARRSMEQGVPVNQALKQAHLTPNKLAPTQIHVQTTTNLLLEAAHSGDLCAFQATLSENRRLMNAVRFVDEVAAPLIKTLGNLWASGQIDVWQEHLISAELAHSLAPLPEERAPHLNNPPVMILATPPGEKHALGLLMAQLVLLHHGVHCLYLGSETPMDDLAKAASATRANMVGLSLSRAFPRRRALAFISALQDQLPTNCELWVGGTGAVSVRETVVCVDTASIKQQLKRWFAAQGAHQKSMP